MEYSCLNNKTQTSVNQTETNSFFNLLEDIEGVYTRDLYDPNPEDLYDPTPEFIEAYDYVMDMVKDAILEGEEIRNLHDLDNFINQADSFTEDYKGEYGKGYKMATSICLAVMSQLIQSEEV